MSLKTTFIFYPLPELKYIKATSGLQGDQWLNQYDLASVMLMEYELSTLDRSEVTGNVCWTNIHADKRTELNYMLYHVLANVS